MTTPVRFNDDKERVRDASDIVRLIGEHIAIKAKGREYVCLCPFHDDHKPSMTISPGKQLFKCFVCGAGGDAFGFVQKYHKMEFREALEYLAEKAGIELSRRGGRAETRVEPTADGLSGEATITRADLVRANATAAEFFRLILGRDDLGTVGREVIGRRGISPAMVEAFGLGLSPDRWDGLLVTIQGKGLDPRAFAEAGLLKQRDSGGFYDAFRNRLMFPIQDQIGRVIAFGARKINEEDEPKYLNSAESRVFEKSGTLYGLYQAARAIQTERTAVITEGYTDTIACHQAGFTNTIATLGTALTARHAAVLRRLCDTVVLLFDGDQAGQKAADRAVEVFFAEEIDVKIATLSSVTDAKDPDELLKREGGADLLRAAIAQSTDLLAYRYARIRQSLAGAGMAALTKAIQEELQRLVQLGLNNLPLLRRKLIVNQIARIAGVDEETIWASIPGGRRGPGFQYRPDPAPAAAPALSSQQKILVDTLGCLMCEPSLWLTLTDADKEALDPAHLPAGPARAAAEALFDLAASGHGCGVSAVVALLDDPDAQGVATNAHDRMSDLAEGSPDRVKAYFRDSLRKLSRDESARSSGIDQIRKQHAAVGGSFVVPRPRPV